MSQGPKTILHLVSYPLFSGPLPQTLNLARAQRAAGHRVFLAYDRKRGTQPINDFEEAAAPAVDPSALDVPGDALVLSAKSSLWELWKDRKRLQTILHTTHVDIVHVHLSHDHMLARFSGVRKMAPVVRTFHAARSLGTRFGQRWSNNYADAWIVRSTDHQQRLCRQQGKNFISERAEVLEGSIDAKAFSVGSASERRAARDKFGVPQDARLVAHVALIHDRGQEELAHALAELNAKDVHLMYVGKGEHEAALRVLVRTKGLENQVHFVGYQQGVEALRAVYHAADAAFIAQAGNDASVRAVMEAMACGVPVLGVCDRDRAIAELLEQGRGYPVSSRTPRLIAEALRYLLDDMQSNAYNRVRRAARSWMETEHAIAHEADRTDALYGRAISAWRRDNTDS